MEDSTQIDDVGVPPHVRKPGIWIVAKWRFHMEIRHVWPLQNNLDYGQRERFWAHICTRKKWHQKWCWSHMVQKIFLNLSSFKVDIVPCFFWSSVSSSNFQVTVKSSLLATYQCWSWHEWNQWNLQKGKRLGVEPLQKNTTRILKNVFLSLMFCFGEGKTRIEPSKTWDNTIYSQRRPNWHLKKSRSNEQSAPSGQFNLIQVSLCMKLAGLVEIVFTTRCETWFTSSRLVTDNTVSEKGRTKPFLKCFVNEVTVWSINGEPPWDTDQRSAPRLYLQNFLACASVFISLLPPCTRPITFVSIYIYVYIYVYIYICICIYIYVYTSLHIYI